MSLASSTHVTVITCSRPALIVLSPRIPVPRRKHFFRLFSAVHVSSVWIQSWRTLSIKVAFRLMPEILTCGRVFPLLCVLQFLADWAAVYGLIDEAASLRGVRPSVLRAVASGRGCYVRAVLSSSRRQRDTATHCRQVVDNCQLRTLSRVLGSVLLNHPSIYVSSRSLQAMQSAQSSTREPR